MSLGMFHVMPLVKGWEWLPTIGYEQTLKRGQEVEYEFRGTGWLMGIALITTDENTQMEIWSRSGKQGMKKIFGPTSALSTKWSATVDPTGNSLIYKKTNATSSAGFYYCQLFNGWGTGSLLPFLDRTRTKVKLGTNSTQNEAYSFVGYGIINITDISLFVRSIREISGARNMNIDTSLVEFAEQYKKDA